MFGGGMAGLVSGIALLPRGGRKKSLAAAPWLAHGGPTIDLNSSRQSLPVSVILFM